MSVFTFDHDPPRVASPWLHPSDPGKSSSPRAHSLSPSQQTGSLSEYGVTKLDAEPQEGPTEYKLHLLLRPRRAYASMSTVDRGVGSQHPRDAKESKLAHLPYWTPASSNQTRQDRLQQLTTQLLWRLQQSSPYHAKSSGTDIAPLLPDDSVNLSMPVKVGNLVPGIEASRGALYEIGVADDGTLVGLTKDEMDESLNTLRVMAASLGCKVEVLRMVMVGECTWADTPAAGSTGPGILRKDKLWVTEALVTPVLSSRLTDQSDETATDHQTPATVDPPLKGAFTADQLRVTLTGPTTSGKSTLLGTLSTGLLDNGRGKSRMNLLKHQHELASGMTSSVSQELLGYKNGEIYSYSNPGIESWVDIHDLTQDGRLVFVSDCAGHPRYRRTIMRGLIGWSPHWTMLCIAADDSNATLDVGATATAKEILGNAGAHIDLAMSYLELCLTLELPFVVIITKLDLTTKSSLQSTLGKVFSMVKDAGRVPKLLPPDRTGYPNCSSIPSRNDADVRQITDEMSLSGDLLSVVPVVLTSASKGTGIGLVHALLQNLPRPSAPTPYDFTGKVLNPEQPACLFHIDDKFSLPASYATVTMHSDQAGDMGTVVAGYLRFGRLAVGDKVLIGPFPSFDDDARGATPEDRPSPGSYGLSISHPSSAELSLYAAKNAISAEYIKGEWHGATIVSIRNLRLPVQTLEAGQVGTIGVVFSSPDEDLADSVFERPAPPLPKIRKGMVLAVPSKHMIDTGLSLQAATGLTVLLRNGQAPHLVVGSLVNLYVATVRASARVLRVTRARSPENAGDVPTEDIDDVFSLNERMDGDQGPSSSGSRSAVEVQLELLSNREWIELGSRILILEGGRNDKSGLEGFVGKVVEIVD